MGQPSRVGLDALLWMAVYPIGTDKAAFLKVSIACAVVLTALAMLFQKQLHALVCRFRTTTAQVILRRFPRSCCSPGSSCFTWSEIRAWQVRMPTTVGIERWCRRPE